MDGRQLPSKRPFVPSNAEIDRLGDRYAADPTNLEYLSQLFLFCQSVKARVGEITASIRSATELPIVPRDGKSFRSIAEKLRRGSVKLSGMQDVEGCRIIVDSPAEQELLVFRLASRFENCKIDDLREKPQNGYRAIHVIVRAGGARYEIQVRTSLQQDWAQVSEDLAARHGQGIKYGIVPKTAAAEKAVADLNTISDLLREFEQNELTVWNLYLGHLNDTTEKFIEDLVTWYDVGPLVGDTTQVNLSQWAVNATRTLLGWKNVWRQSLLDALETGRFDDSEGLQ